MKKIISLIATFAMLLSVLAVGTFSLSTSAQSAPWDGLSVSEVYSGGSGTADDPYIIANGADLMKLSDDVNFLQDVQSGVHFKLADDINLGGHMFTPIGEGNIYFQGVFDGNGKTIFNFTANSDFPAIFGHAGYGGTIRNLKVDHAVFTCTNTYGAAIVAFAERNLLIENCEVGENVVIENTDIAAENPMLAGVVAMALETVANNIISRATVVAKKASNNVYIGGAFGAISARDGHVGYIENVIFTGSVIVEGSNAFATSSAGGIVGALGAKSRPGIVRNVINRGSVKATGDKAACGGIVGKTNTKNGQIVNAFNESTEIYGTVGSGMFVGQVSNTYTVEGGCSIETGTLNLFAGRVPMGVEQPTEGFKTVASDIEFAFEAAYASILSSIQSNVPTWNTIDPNAQPEDSTPADSTPSTPVDSTPADSTPSTPTDSTPADSTPSTPTDSTPAESTPSTPADSGTVEAPVDTTPQTPAQTQKPSAGTEKPADDGGCGSIIASGLAIVAVVSLAGVTLLKKRV